MLQYPFTVEYYGDNALLLNFKAESCLELTHYIYSLSQAIEKLNLTGFIETVSAYDSLLIIFNSLVWQPQEAVMQISSFAESSSAEDTKPQRRIKIPVCYSSELAPDLDSYCQEKGISIEGLIAQHTSAQYHVEMLGFLPGFLYLSGLPKSLSHPRKTTPELKVPAGSVAIGGEQTGIYPLASPGGWHIIGRTPMEFFDLTQTPPITIKPLDGITFYAISYEEFCSYGN